MSELTASQYTLFCDFFFSGTTLLLFLPNTPIIVRSTGASRCFIFRGGLSPRSQQLSSLCDHRAGGGHPPKGTGCTSQHRWRCFFFLFCFFREICVEFEGDSRGLGFSLQVSTNSDRNAGQSLHVKISKVLIFLSQFCFCCFYYYFFFFPVVVPLPGHTAFRRPGGGR